MSIPIEKSDIELFNVFIEFIEETCNEKLAKKYRDKFNEKLKEKINEEKNNMLSKIEKIEKLTN